MPRSVSFHPEALRDAEESAIWYAERSARAADRFLDELDRLIHRIAETPDSFPTFDGDLRRALFRRFPFYVVFWSDHTSVMIFAVAHGKRRPGFWRGRN